MLLKKQPQARGRQGHRRARQPWWSSPDSCPLVYGLASAESDGWGAATTLVCIGVGLALLAAFAVIESRVSNPLLPLHIVWDRTRGASFLVVAFVGIGLFAVFLFLTYYVSLTLGYSPLKTGFSFVPMILGIMATATGSAGLVTRIGPRIPVFVGMLLAAVGMVLFAQLEVDSTYAAHILPGLVVTGLGIGLSHRAGLQRRDVGRRPRARRGRLGLGQHLPADRRIDRHRGAERLRGHRRRRDYLSGLGRAPSAADQALAAVDGYTTVFWWAAGVFAVGAVICGALFRPGPVAVDPDALVLAHWTHPAESARLGRRTQSAVAPTRAWSRSVRSVVTLLSAPASASASISASISAGLGSKSTSTVWKPLSCWALARSV